MKTAEEYLTKLYERIKPRLVVEIGADPSMTLVARTGHLAKKIAVVDFKGLNDYKEGWWGLHREMGINLKRIDGNACELSKLVTKADVVYAHNVLIELENGDTKKRLDYINRKINLPRTEVRTMANRFIQAQNMALEEACKVASKGHVIWFAEKDKNGVFSDPFRFNKVFSQGEVVGSCGEYDDFVLKFWHLMPINFDWIGGQQYLPFL